MKRFHLFFGIPILLLIILELFISCKSTYNYTYEYNGKIYTIKISKDHIFYDYLKEDAFYEDNYSFLDSNRMFIVDTVIIKKPVLIANREEIFITDSSTACNINIQDFEELQNNKRVYLFREWKTRLLPYRFQKKFPFNNNQIGNIYEIPHKPDSVIYSNHHRVISIRYINKDSLRFFVCLDNYYCERDEKFHRSHPPMEKGWSPYEFSPVSRLNYYIRVVRPIDYIDLMPLWSKLNQDKDKIDEFILDSKNFNYGKNEIERRDFLIKLDSSLLRYSKIPQAFYDSITYRKYPIIYLNDI